MDITLPSLDEVRAELARLTLKQMDQLAALSGVAAPTIYKIRLGTTANPGIETLRGFLPHLKAVQRTGSEEKAG